MKFTSVSSAIVCYTVNILVHHLVAITDLLVSISVPIKLSNRWLFILINGLFFSVKITKVAVICITLSCVAILSFVILVIYISSNRHSKPFVKEPLKPTHGMFIFIFSATKLVLF